MRDGQGRGGKGDLHAVPRSAFCRPHTEGLWLLGAHPHAAGARCCPATPRLSPRAHPSGSPQGPPAAQLGPLACISLGHSLSPGARTLNPCSATVPTGHQSPLPCSSPQQPRERPSWCRVQPHGPSSLCPLGEGVGIPRRQTARRAQSLCCSPPPLDAGQAGGLRCSLCRQPPPRAESGRTSSRWRGPGQGQRGRLCVRLGAMRARRRPAAGRDRACQDPAWAVPTAAGPLRHVAATCLEPRTERGAGRETQLGPADCPAPLLDAARAERRQR